MVIAFIGVTMVVILNDLFFHVTPTLYICCVNLLSSSSCIVSTVCLIELRRLNYLIRLICSGEGSTDSSARVCAITSSGRKRFVVVLSSNTFFPLPML